MANTRSKFIILHDYRLFSKKINYIWKRIVNVIFVREYGNSHRKNVSTGKWFELSTVLFPFAIKEVFVSKQLDIWRSGRYRRKAILFPDKILNLKGTFCFCFNIFT